MGKRAERQNRQQNGGGTPKKGKRGGDAAKTQPMSSPEQLRQEAEQKAREAREAEKVAKAAEKAAKKAAKEAEKKAAKAAEEAAKARAAQLAEAKREWCTTEAWVPMKNGVEIGVPVKKYHKACNPKWDDPRMVVVWVYPDGSLGPRLTDEEQLEYNARGYSA